ncbi:hypothetical protein [Paenibacillus apiarius]|nr:hypothetical protein [Paenibacillus apiarius]MEC0119106.1 hypothetical protein [Paenibacillus apiarius]MEC0194493.1 hypothetical protein [Paenibacillus apiarius]
MSEEAPSAGGGGILDKSNPLARCLLIEGENEAKGQLKRVFYA